MTHILRMTVALFLVIAICVLALLVGGRGGDDQPGGETVTNDTIRIRIVPGSKWEVDPEPDGLLVSASHRNVIRVVLENLTPESISLPGSMKTHQLYELRWGLIGHGLREGWLGMLNERFYRADENHEIRAGEEFEHHILLPYSKMQVGRDYKLTITYGGGRELNKSYRLYVAR